jgi:hypothetical protein
MESFFLLAGESGRIPAAGNLSDQPNVREMNRLFIRCRLAGIAHPLAIR